MEVMLRAVRVIREDEIKQRNGLPIPIQDELLNPPWGNPLEDNLYSVYNEMQCIHKQNKIPGPILKNYENEFHPGAAGSLHHRLFAHIHKYQSS